MWKVTSRGCFCGAGGWRKEAEHLTLSLEADKMLQEQQRSRRRLPDISLSHLTSVLRQEGDRRKGGTTPWSLLHHLLSFLQKGHAALTRGEILSFVTRALMIYVWFADLSVGETQVTAALGFIWVLLLQHQC